MKKELSVRRLLIDSLHFIRSNLLLLGFLTILSFIGFYAFAAVSVRNLMFFIGYGVFLYFFHYTFVGLYLGKKPIFSAERFVEAFVKLLTLFVLSFAFWQFLRIGRTAARFLVERFVGQADWYGLLKTSYLDWTGTTSYGLAVYLLVIALLSLSFFIPGFAWIASIDETDNSVFAAYEKVSGHYLKTIYIFVLFYGVLPFLVSLIGLHFSTCVVAALYTLQTIFQLIVYLHLYEFYYKESKSK
jgi:hypothetical protein